MNYRHGKAKSQIYRIWSAMRNRCQNPNVPAFRNYGGRGITVCDRWQDFANFYADMGDRPDGKSLDRINNDLGYSPENCRWAGRGQQARNKRSLRMVTANGHTRCLGEWAEITGLSVSTLWARLHYGWSEDATVSTPKVVGRSGTKWGRHRYELSGAA